jgi:hypothetical protein
MFSTVEVIGLVDESGLKGSITRSDLKTLMTSTLPFNPYWYAFESIINDQGQLVPLEVLNEGVDSEDFRRTLPMVFNGRTQLQNAKLIKVAAYLIANGLISHSLIRRALSIFSVFEKSSPFRRFEANPITVRKAINALSMLASEKIVTVWLESTAGLRNHELFLVCHEFLFLVCNATERSEAINQLPALESSITMQHNLFVLDPCTHGNQNPSFRAQNVVETQANGSKIKVLGASTALEFFSKRTKLCDQYLAKPYSKATDLQDFKKLLWDKELSKHVREVVDNISLSSKKSKASVLARRYRELSDCSRASRSAASSPRPANRNSIRMGLHLRFKP